MSSLKYKIVADSSIDVKAVSGVDFAVAPLKIITAEREFVDDDSLDIEAMADYLLTYSGKSQTSCPNPADWISAFADADRVFCITITATLSGSYNAAMIAKRRYEEEHPDRRVFVINSLSTGPEMALIADKLSALISEGMEFDAICEAITEYTKTTGLLFMLESMRNLVNNGRVSPIVAKIAGFLGFRVVGKASDKGDLEQLDKCRGEPRALASMLENMKKLGYSGKRVNIAHCLNESAAQKLKALIVAEFADADVKIYSLGGLCSFYAEKHGIIVGFEK